MAISRTSASLLVGLALVCVSGVAAWLLYGDGGADDPLADCPVVAQPLDPAVQFVDRADLLPQGSVGQGRRPVVDGLSGRGPIGEVVAGRFFEKDSAVPSVVPLLDRVAMVSAPADGPAVVTAIDPAAEVPSTEWVTELTPDGEPWTSFTGGAVDDAWVSVFSGPRPTLVTMDADGSAVACLSIPLDAGGADTLAVTDQSGTDVVVLASAPTAGWWLGVVDPVAGEVEASTRSEAPQTWQEVKVAGDLVVGSRWRASTVGTSGEPHPTDAQEPWLRAWGLDGEERWTYPAASARPFPAVLLDVDDDGTSYAVSFDRGGPRLVAVDPEGRPRWTTKLRRGEWSGELWGGVLVVRGPDPRGGPMLRAFDVRDGQERFVVRARQAPPVGGSPRSGFGSPLTEPDAWWVPSPNGLLRIDRRTGDVRRVDTGAPVEELLGVGDQVLVRSGPALLLTR